MRVAPVAVRFAGDLRRVIAEADRSARATHGHLFAIDAARVQAAAVAAALRGTDVLESSRSAAATAELRHQLDGVGALLTRAGARPAQPVGGESPPPPTEPRPDEGAVPGTREGLPAPTEVAAILGTDSTGPESVPAALYSVLAHERFKGAVAFAIRCGGDTDTVGAMTGAIAGARHGASAIPDRWLRPLEDGERGRSYVTDLAERLLREREAVRR